MIDAISAWLKTCLHRTHHRGAAARRSSFLRRRPGRDSSPLAVESLEARTVFDAGDLDPTFGHNGVVSLSGYNWTDQAFQADGKIVAVGTTAGETTRDVVVARFNSNGSLDTTFADAGVAVIDVLGDSHDEALAVTIDVAGRVLVAGRTSTFVELGPGDRTWTQFMAVLRLTSAGELDSTFSDDGKATIGFAGNIESARAIAVDSQGRIVVAGGVNNYPVSSSDMAVARLNDDGTLDASFSDDGMTSIDFGGSGTANAIAIDSNDKIVVAGVGNSRFAAARFNVDGSLDPGFGTDGLFSRTASNGYGEAFAVVIDAQGGVLLGGSEAQHQIIRLTSAGVLDAGVGLISVTTATQDVRDLAFDAQGRLVFTGRGSSNDMVVGRLRANWLGLDTTFSGDGHASAGGAAADHPHALKVNLNGTIVVTGGYYDSNASFYTTTALQIAQFTASGALDSSFDGDGFASIEVGPRNFNVAATAVQSDGKVVVVGASGGSAWVRRYLIDGSLDAAFGVDGTTILGFDSGNVSALGVFIDASGRIMFAGGIRGKAALARLTSDGSLDLSFGVGGKATSLTIDGGFTSVTRDGQGRFVFGGVVFNEGTFGDFAVMRLTAEGEVDFSFGGSGWTSVNFDGTSNDDARAVTVDDTDRIVLVGGTQIPNATGTNLLFDLAVARFNADGTLDTTFDDDGLLTANFSPEGYESGRDVIVDDQGRILIVGYLGLVTQVPYKARTIVALTDNGSIDATFGESGCLFDVGQPFSTTFSKLTLDAEGRLLVAGYTNRGDLAIRRYSNNGVIDASFSGPVIAGAESPGMD